MSVAKEYIKEYKRRRRLELALDITKTRLADLDPQVLEYLGEEGFDKLSLDGYTIRAASQIWASAPTPEAIEMVKKQFPSVVKETANTQTLSGLIREMVKETVNKTVEELPEWCIELNISTKHKVGITKAAKSKK